MLSSSAGAGKPCILARPVLIVSPAKSSVAPTLSTASVAPPYIALPVSFTSSIGLSGKKPWSLLSNALACITCCCISKASAAISAPPSFNSSAYVAGVASNSLEILPLKPVSTDSSVDSSVNSSSSFSIS